MSSYALTGGTPYAPSDANQDARRQSPAPRPASRPAPTAGVVVSLGPAGPGAPKNEFFTQWVTLPLTPTALPVQVAALWQDAQLLGAGNRSSFGGPDEALIAFSGQLEPPAYYAAAAKIRAIAAYDAGALASAPNQLLELEAAAAGGAIDTTLPTNLSDTTLIPLPPEPRLPGGTGVVMQPGGNGTAYIEPLTLNAMFTEACEHGEVIRLVIGDEYGFNGLIDIRTYTWKFEDPDPDVLDFEFSGKAWRPRPSLVATAQTSSKKAKHTWHQVQVGEDLLTIAAKEGLGVEQSAVDTIVKLNVKTLGALWVYPDRRYGESAGPRNVVPPGAKPGSGHAYGAVSAKHFNPNMALRHGFKLRLR